MMKIIKDNRIDLHLLKEALGKPEIGTKSTSKFWDDQYISSQMLNLHLNPDIESASKTRETIAAECDFIITWTGMNKDKSVVDLGCGPGLYVREFAKSGARVTGIDYSSRSIKYARQTVEAQYETAFFREMNYLDLDYEDTFDIATLIFYDFCVLSTREQNTLLSKIHQALKANGVFIFDVITDNRKIVESTSITISEGGGFWSSEPYIEILKTYVYEDPRTEGLQYSIIAQDGQTRVIRLYHRLFDETSITTLLNDNGFQVEGIYKNLKGESLSNDSETFGIIARKV